MDHIQLINSLIEQERRLAFEEERRKSRHFELYMNYLAAPQFCQKERKSIFGRIFQQRKEDQIPTDHVNTPKF